MEYSAEIALSIQAIGPIRQPFDEPRLKTKQAKRHLNRLRVLEDDHFATDWYDYEFKPTSADSQASLNVIVQLPGPEFGAVVGDVVHNCRAALDIMASLIVRLNGGNDRNVYFPFGSSAEEFEKMIPKKKFNRASAEAVDLLKSLKPYPEGNAVLRGLHDLDIFDKHRALIPAGANVTTPEVKADVIDGKAVITHVEHTNPKMRLIFPEEAPLGNTEIIPALQEIINLVDGIIQAFETLLTN